MLGKLGEKGLVKHKRYGAVSLTPQGRRIGKEVSGRHVDLINFLRLLGVDRRSAESDACKIEHILDSKTMEKLKGFIRFIEEAPEKPTWLEHYRYFIKTGKHPECEHRAYRKRYLKI